MVRGRVYICDVVLKVMAVELNSALSDSTGLGAGEIMINRADHAQWSYTIS